jgi:FtsZ-binding cell division protein ZapB
VENAFDLLEERVRRAAETLRWLQGENADLKKQLSRAQGALQQAERATLAAEKRQATGSPEDRRKLETLGEEAVALRKEREEVRVRMARIVEILDGLD